MTRQMCSMAVAAVAACAIIGAAPAQAQTTIDLSKYTAAPGTTPAAFLVNGVANASEEQQSASGNRRHEGIGIGVKGGFLWPSFGDAQGAGFEENTGWLLGLFIGGNRGGVLGAQTEIQYGKRGASSGSIDFEQYFIEIPVLARVNIGSNSLNGVSFYGMAGPVFDINLSTKLAGVDVADNYESLDVGMLIAGGVEITRLFVEARYNQGFKNVLKSGGGAISDTNNKYFAIQLGLRFN